MVAIFVVSEPASEKLETDAFKLIILVVDPVDTAAAAAAATDVDFPTDVDSELKFGPFVVGRDTSAETEPAIVVGFGPDAVEPTFCAVELVSASEVLFLLVVLPVAVDVDWAVDLPVTSVEIAGEDWSHVSDV